MFLVEIWVPKISIYYLHIVFESLQQLSSVEINKVPAPKPNDKA